MEEIRRHVGETAIDSDLTPEEREYLAASLGLDEYSDPQLEQDAPFCRSCISHGSDRVDYPCLQKVCGWEERRRRNRFSTGNVANISASWTTTATYYATSTSNSTAYYNRWRHP